jgi:hypothetical protein
LAWASIAATATSTVWNAWRNMPSAGEITSIHALADDPDVAAWYIYDQARSARRVQVPLPRTGALTPDQLAAITTVSLPVALRAYAEQPRDHRGQVLVGSPPLRNGRRTGRLDYK